jgi:hypothetical protein
MSTTTDLYQACIEACDACALACDTCAAACLREPDSRTMARCIAFDMDCTDLCRLASALMARGSEYVREVCRICATVCEACADECSKHAMDHCRRCAEACRRCAYECKGVAV